MSESTQELAAKAIIEDFLRYDIHMTSMPIQEKLADVWGRSSASSSDREDVSAKLAALLRQVFKGEE
jgi:hypothetical protein